MEDPNSQNLCWELGLEKEEAEMGQAEPRHTPSVPKGPNDRQKGPQVGIVVPEVHAVGA